MEIWRKDSSGKEINKTFQGDGQELGVFLDQGGDHCSWRETKKRKAERYQRNNVGENRADP